MAYKRVNWENLPSTKTPINQTNLNKMENAIDQAGAEIFVGAEEPTTGEKVWFNKNKNSIYVRNSNGVYEEFIKVDNLERINRTLIPTGTKIVANSDLNTINFLKVGKYYCDSNATTASLSNCPTNSGFMMEVFNVLTNKIDDEETGIWINRTRRILTLDGGVFYQHCWSNQNKKWTYENWRKVSMTNV